jgi:phytoene synthase
LYGFVRVPDEWVDHASPLRANAAEKLAAYRRETIEGFRGQRPNEPVLRAFLDVARECGMTPSEPLLFLDAMESDLTVTRYRTYADLERYMRGSASAVGLMLCDIMGVQRTAAITEGAMALGEAMQLTNFLRDVGEDLGRGRVYLPLEDMDRFGVTVEDLINRRKSPEFIELMDFEIRRARKLYEVADRSIPELPRAMQRPVRLSRVLYSRILNRIEASGYDVFHRRARTTSTEKLTAAVGVLMSRK